MARRERITVNVTVWVDCVGCWGQRVQIIQDEDGAWSSRICPNCLGIGQVARDVEQTQWREAA